MRKPVMCRYASVALVSAVIAVVHAADAKLSPQQAESFEKKIDTIAAQANRPSSLRRTSFSEAELNSWFAYRAQPLLPSGVAEPAVSILGNGRLSGRAVVDLDAVAKKRANGGVLDPWSYLGGRVPVTVTGTLQTREGVGRFELESAQVSSVPVPKVLLQELLSAYSRSPNRPQGVSLEAPFQLPANIQRIDVGQGQAVVVQ